MQITFLCLRQSKNVHGRNDGSRGELGFTLIELLTVIATIGVLVSLALTGFSVYRASAAYAVATSTYKSARNALEAAVSDPSSLPGAVALTRVTAPGPITAAPASSIMPGMQMPKNMKLQISYDPACEDATCIEAFLSTRHCLGKEYLYWFRRGDGVESLIENVSGAGCP
jgi:prepilin-type N-terminal cleavage/methylation domain-containing protein